MKNIYMSGMKKLIIVYRYIYDYYMNYDFDIDTSVDMQ